jgi:hypothetical protein
VAEWGHIHLSRKFFDCDPFWNEDRPRTKAEAWIDMIQMAAWKERRFTIGQTIELLQRGEFQASVRFLAQRWRWGKHVVEKFLEVCQKGGRLTKRREGQAGAVYLLVNYEQYNPTTNGTGTPQNGVSGDTSGTPRGHLGDKTEEGKERKEGKSKNNGSHPTWLSPFSSLWTVGTPPFGQLAGVLKPLIATHNEAEVLEHWSRYLQSTEPKFWSPRRFQNTYNAWDAAVAVPGLKDEPGEDFYADG